VKNHRVVTVQINTSGAPVGQFFLQVSNDKLIWITVGITPPMILTGTVLNFGESFDKYAWEWVQLIYVAGGGSSGTVTALLSANSG
jgi:hypothetical protein